MLQLHAFTAKRDSGSASPDIDGIKRIATAVRFFHT